MSKKAKAHTFSVRLSERGMLHVELLAQKLGELSTKTTIVRQAAEQGLEAMAKSKKG